MSGQVRREPESHRIHTGSNNRTTDRDSESGDAPKPANVEPPSGLGTFGARFR